MYVLGCREVLEVPPGVSGGTCRTSCGVRRYLPFVLGCLGVLDVPPEVPGGTGSFLGSGGTFFTSRVVGRCLPYVLGSLHTHDCTRMTAHASRQVKLEPEFNTIPHEKGVITVSLSACPHLAAAHQCPHPLALPCIIARA
jgi:hypothetical protein